MHGIGQHDDFLDEAFTSWDGTEGVGGGNYQFRELLERVTREKLGAGLPEFNLAVRSVEWHSVVHSSEGSSPLERVSPDGVAPLRTFTRSAVMDVLYCECHVLRP